MTKIKKKLGNNFRNLTLNRHPGLYRPTNNLFLTGDTLRKYCNHIFDETTSLNPKNVKLNDLVFLKTNLKEIFFSLYHPQIVNPYILICHNSDISFDLVDLEKLDEKIIHCFTQNLNTESNSQLSPIPIGFENRRYRNNGKLNILNKHQVNQNLKNNKIFSSFSTSTNYILRKPLELISKKRDDIYYKKFNNSKDYFFELSKSEFNLCPSGNGLDTHRIWETLLVKATPVVERNYLTESLFNEGVPLLIIDNWDTFYQLTYDDLVNLNSKNLHKDGYKYIKSDYWLKKINSYKIEA